MKKLHIREIKAETLKEEKFIERQVRELKKTVGKGLAINALSGGVDSSVVTALGHRALGRRLKTYFINNGLMRENEPRQVAAVFKKLGIPVEIVDARKEFFKALKGITDPEEKREAITQTFYKNVFRVCAKSK
jgi:GMP synthase (glutamine-hydrolysing)